MKNQDAHDKHERQTLLLEIVRGSEIATQEELVEQLHAAGIPCTQASVSRDVRELGLVKVGGHYAAPQAATAVPDLDVFATKIGSFLMPATVVGENLVVIRTLPATAHSVALYIDGVGWRGVAGTVAGDDTLFVAVANLETANWVVAELERIREASL
jgi:transcriptional regulator of arginine metabolism